MKFYVEWVFRVIIVPLTKWLRNKYSFELRVTDWENQAEVGTWGSADLPYISVGGHPWLTSNHGNICFLIALITFRLDHTPEIPNFRR